MRFEVGVIFFVFFSLCASEKENSALYLQSAIRDLSKKKSPVPVEIVPKKPFENDVFDAENRLGNPEIKAHPSLSLTQGELNSIYEAVASKGSGKIVVNAPPDDLPYFVPTIPPKRIIQDELEDEEEEAEEQQYYYYYIPLKNILNRDKKSHAEASAISTDVEKFPVDSYYPHNHRHKITKHPNSKGLYNYHTHNHQVNVKVQQLKPLEKKKALEPLFMAISGFIGMAAMVIVGILCLPKFGKIKSRSDYENDDGISNVTLQILTGQDCTERFTCELGKKAYSYGLHNSRFTKLLRRFSPKFLSRQIDKIRKYAQKKYECSTVICKRR